MRFLKIIKVSIIVNKIKLSFLKQFVLWQTRFFRKKIFVTIFMINNIVCEYSKFKLITFKIFFYKLIISFNFL